MGLTVTYTRERSKERQLFQPLRTMAQLSRARARAVPAASVRNPSAAGCGNTSATCLKQVSVLTAEHPTPVFFTFLFCHPWCWHHPQGDRKMAAIPDRSSFKQRQRPWKHLGRPLPTCLRPASGHTCSPTPVPGKASHSNHAEEEEEEESDGRCLLSRPLTCSHLEPPVKSSGTL